MDEIKFEEQTEGEKEEFVDHPAKVMQDETGMDLQDPSPDMQMMDEDKKSNSEEGGKELELTFSQQIKKEESEKDVEESAHEEEAEYGKSGPVKADQADAEDEDKIWEIAAYRLQKKIRRYRKAAAAGAITAVILVAGFGVSYGIRHHTFSSYEITHSSDQEDTLSYTFLGLGENIMRYGIDSAQLMNREGSILWTDTYTMNNPYITVFGTTAAVYDKGGTSIVVYGEKGRIGEVSTGMPIVKAKTASQGVVAAILENGDDTWIKYYNGYGEEIASFRTRIDSPGYPLDISLSEDGMVMAVSYAYAESGEMKTQMAFYNFGSTGQNLVDNLVLAENYSGVLAPEVEYVDKDTCIAFFENGFRVYEGVKKPAVVSKVEEEREIISCAYNSSRVALVERGDDEENPYILKVFQLNGKEVFSSAFDFAYETMEMNEKQILFFNRQEVCIYSLDGIEKFRGATEEGQLSNVIGLGRNRYMLITEEGIRAIKLK